MTPDQETRVRVLENEMVRREEQFKAMREELIALRHEMKEELGALRLEMKEKVGRLTTAFTTAAIGLFMAVVGFAVFVLEGLTR